MGSEGGGPWAAFFKGGRDTVKLSRTILMFSLASTEKHYSRSTGMKHDKRESPLQFECRELKFLFHSWLSFRQRVHCISSLHSLFCVFATHTCIFPQSSATLSAAPCHRSRGLEWQEKRMCSGRAVSGAEKGSKKERKEGEKEWRGVWGAGVMTLHAFVFGVAAVQGPSTGCHLAAHQLSLFLLLAHSCRLL